MSVSFGRAVRDKLRQRGVVVYEWSGWESRGNGQTSNYQGGIMHHTATAYGVAPRILVDGRSDLSGPLCNTAGNDDGSVTMIAAHPANHAGASGGRSMGPLPVTSSFNKLVWGHEIVYPGDKPMTDAQYNTMLILGDVLTEILGRANSEWIRSHYETSITGKWDPGYAPGKTIDMSIVRKQINDGTGGVDLTPEEHGWLKGLNDVFGPYFKESGGKAIGLGIWQIEQAIGEAFKLSGGKTIGRLINELNDKVDGLDTPSVDTVQLAQKIVADLVLEGVLTADQVVEAVKRANREQWNK